MTRVCADAMQPSGRVEAPGGTICARAGTPRMSATPYPPTGFPGSTFGEAGLNFRVRNGTG